MRPGIIAALLKKDLKYIVKDKTAVPFGLMALGLSWIIALLLANPGEAHPLAPIIDFFGIVFAVCGLGPTTLSTHIGEENWSKTARSLMESGVKPRELFASKILANYTYIQIVSLSILISKGFTIYQITVIAGFITLTYIPMSFIGLIMGILVNDYAHANRLCMFPMFLFFMLPLYGIMSEIRLINIAGMLTPANSFIYLSSSILKLDLYQELNLSGFMGTDLFLWVILFLYTVGCITAFCLLYKYKSKSKNDSFYIIPQ